MAKRERLIARRKELSKSQERLASDAGVTKRSVIRWEAGAEIRLDQRPKYAHGLEWSMSTFNAAIAQDDGLSDRLNGHRVTRLGHLVSLEQGAAEIWTFETTVCAGLLQTEAYAVVVESVAPDRPSSGEVAHRVAVRMRRQEVLERDVPLRLQVLLDASVLLRETGGPEVMAGQIEHLHRMAEQPHIEIRVLPLDERAHAAGRGAFWLITSHDDAVPFMAVTDTAAGVQYFDSEAAVTAHVELWAHLWGISDALA